MIKYPRVLMLFCGGDVLGILNRIEKLRNETENLDSKKMCSEAYAFTKHVMSRPRRDLEIKTFKDPKYSDAINCIFDIFFDEKGEYKWNEKE